MYDYTSTSSWTVVVSAIILIGATYLVPGHQPTTLRPFTTDQASARPLFPDSVQARLWQDPIEAGWQHIRSFSPVDKGKDENIPDKLWDEWEKAPDTLQSRIDSNAKSVFYLPIVLSGKPYPESRERLLRSRFALQEAMETLEYRPLNSDKLREPRKIRFLEVKWSTKANFYCPSTLVQNYAL